MNILYFSAKTEDLNQQTRLLLSAYLQAKAATSRPFYFTPATIYAELFGDTKIKQAIKKEYVQILSEIPYVHHAYDYVYYVTTNEILEQRYDQYITMSSDDFWQMVDAKITRVLSHYLFMVRSFNGKMDLAGEAYAAGFMPQGYFAKEENVTAQTISRKNHLLEKYKLIYFRHGTYDSATGTTHPTYYCRYENRTKLLTKNLGDMAPSEMNGRRSVSMRYLHFIKNPLKYSVEEVEALYAAVTEYNNSITDKSKMKDVRPLLDIIKRS